VLACSADYEEDREGGSRPYKHSHPTCSARG
jgi:hypothetical protein